MRLFIFAVLALVSLRSFAGASAESLVGAYDLGPRAASIVLSMTVDETDAPVGKLTFCRRQTLIEKHRCTGEGMAIRCPLTGPRSWTCDEGGDYPFHAVITLVSEKEITYEFKSSFNEGSLRGQRLE